jgi:TetR/AcrR family transcriptional regulator
VANDDIGAAARPPEDPAAPEDLPCRLARVATALFADKGYAAVSVREICEAAGATKPMLYYYFGSKEGLFRRLIEETFDRFNAILHESEARDLPIRAFLETYAAAHLHWVTERPEHARLVFATSMGHQRGAPAIDFPRFRDHNAGLLARIFFRAQERGELARLPPEDLIGAYLGIVVMACMRHLEPEQEDRLPIPERAAALAELFLRGAGPAAEGAR